MAIHLYSPAFQDGDVMPARFTADGADISPPLIWEDVPVGTRGFALILHDPDAPKGDFTHWLVYDIPGEVNRIASGSRPVRGALEGVNDFDTAGYRGPQPPKGHGPHRYVFDLYALDTDHIGLNLGASRDDIEKGVEGHVLATARLTARYAR